MGKRFWLSIMAACGVTLSLHADPAAELKFASTIKNVDMGGELLQYQDTRGLEKLFNHFLPAVMNAALPDAGGEGATVKQAVKSVCKLINIGAFKAFAASSKEGEPGIYTAKCFTLIDRTQKSILLNPAAKNLPLDWKKLPADTIIAGKGQVNIAYAWSLIFDEIRNNPDAAVKSIAGEIDKFKQESGIDIHALLNSLDGELEFVISGTSDKDFAFFFAIPDKNGSIAAQLKPMLPPPQEGRSASEFPTPLGNIAIACTPGRITAALRGGSITAPAATIASLPVFQKYAKAVPETGDGYIVLNLSPELLNFVKKSAESSPEAIPFINMIPPSSLLATESVAPAGKLVIAASNFSIPQFCQSYMAILPAISVALPALNSARDRARAVNCVNNMKQFGTGLMVFANDKGDKLPQSIDELLKGKYLPEKICEDVVYLGAGFELSKIKAPSTVPLAICDRGSHGDGEVHICFADGHVESLRVPEESDDRDVIGILNNKYKYAPELLDDLLKKVAEED